MWNRWMVRRGDGRMVNITGQSVFMDVEKVELETGHKEA